MNVHPHLTVISQPPPYPHSMWDSAICLSPPGVLPVQSLVRGGSSPWQNPESRLPPLPCSKRGERMLVPKQRLVTYPGPLPSCIPSLSYPSTRSRCLNSRNPSPFLCKWRKGPQAKMPLIWESELFMQYVLISTQYWKVRERGRQDYHVSARYQQRVSDWRYIICFDFLAPIQNNGVNTLGIFLSFRHSVFIALVLMVYRWLLLRHIGC